MSKEIFGYARVSTKEQSLDRQLVELRRYVPNEENIFTDKQSGKDFERSGYKLLKEKVRADDELYIKSIYRLGRNKEMIKEELRYFQNKGVHVHILDFPQTMVEVKSKSQKSIMELVNNLLIEVFSFMAEEERKYKAQTSRRNSPLETNRQNKNRTPIWTPQNSTSFKLAENICTLARETNKIKRSMVFAENFKEYILSFGERI